MPERQQITLEIARMIREFFLQQNAYHEVDTFSELKKTYLIMKSILHFSKIANSAIDSGTRVHQLLAVKSKDRLAEVKFEKNYALILDEINKQMEKEIGVAK